MHRIIALATCATLALSAGTGLAAGEAKPVSDARAAQQARMKGCNADAKAKALKGEERKAFMGECLKKKAEPSRRRGSQLPNPRDSRSLAVTSRPPQLSRQKPGCPKCCLRNSIHSRTRTGRCLRCGKTA